MSPVSDDDRVGMQHVGAENQVDDYPEDAELGDIDLIVGLYLEDGEPVAVALGLDLANDLDELIRQLRRLPGDAGACGLVSIAGDFFLIVRVRGRQVQAVLSYAAAAFDWPLARDAADFLGYELDDIDDETGPIGDLDLFEDSGLTEFELETICCDLDEDSAELAGQVAHRLKFGAPFRRTVKASFSL